MGDNANASRKNQHSFRVEFINTPLPPDDRAPSTGAFGLGISTQRIDHRVPFWLDGKCITVDLPFISISVHVGESCRVGAAALIARLADMFCLVPAPFRIWLERRAELEKTGKQLEPVFMMDWDTPRPM